MTEKKPVDGGKAAEPQPGDGIRSVRTMNFFRVLNFELYAKPNKVVMWAGVIAFSACTAYIAYINVTKENKKTYMAMSEDGRLEKRTKHSKWD